MSTIFCHFTPPSTRWKTKNKCFVFSAIISTKKDDSILPFFLAFFFWKAISKSLIELRPFSFTAIAIFCNKRKKLESSSVSSHFRRKLLFQPSPCSYKVVAWKGLKKRMRKGKEASVMASLFRFKENDYLWPKLWLKKKNGRKSPLTLWSLKNERRPEWKSFFSNLDY